VTPKLITTDSVIIENPSKTNDPKSFIYIGATSDVRPVETSNTQSINNGNINIPSSINNNQNFNLSQVQTDLNTNPPPHAYPYHPVVFNPQVRFISPESNVSGLSGASPLRQSIVFSYSQVGNNKSPVNNDIKKSKAE